MERTAHTPERSTNSNGAYRTFGHEKLICLYIIAFIQAFGQFSEVGGLPVDPSLPYDSSIFSYDTVYPRSEYAVPFVGVVISIALLFSLVFIVFVCSGGCWPINKIFRNQQPEYPGSFSNPIADSSSGGLSQIDVHALELDPVIFEPLPTLRNLSPQDGRFRTVSKTRIDSNPNESFGALVPFTSDETNIYAHDWFVEPFHNFPRGNLEYFKEVGKAWFGQVIEAEARDIVPYTRKIKVVVKVLREDAGGLEQMRFLDESRLYRESDHGNVLKLLGHSIEMSPFLLILESCPQGNLKSYLIANVTRAEMLNSRGDIIRMALDVAKGLEWMANSGFTHGDLAARNCQVGSEGRILIGDYGLSTQLFKDDYYWSSNIAIPLRWAAPETLHCTTNTIQTLKVTSISNVWTFGICLWEICEFGKLPYFELNDDEVITRVICDKNYVLGHPTMPSLSMRENLFQIMKSCWRTNGEERPSMSEIVREIESLLNELQMSRRNKNDFDLKWEQLANAKGSSSNGTPSPNHNNIRSPKSPSEYGKRKSVSFVEQTPGVENVTSTQSYEQNFSVPGTSEVHLFSQVTHEAVFPKISDPDDEEHWRKRIERGDISEKVRVKSQSVQDLMILTHIQPSELSDPESLISVQKLVQGTPTSSALQSPILRKSSSETALNVSPVPTASGSNESSQPLMTGNSLHTETKKIQSPSKVPNVTINVTKPTPSPSVTINVIEPTPSATENGNDHSDDADSGGPQMSQPERVEVIKRRFKFIFDEEDINLSETQGRHTSTPIRTPSPIMPKNNVSRTEGSDNVFDSPSGRRSPGNTLNESCTISPIIKQSEEQFNLKSDAENSGNYSIVLGASDELGLDLFQAVTTEMEDYSLFQVTDSHLEDRQVRKKIFEDLPSNSSDPMIFGTSFLSEPGVVTNDEWNTTEIESNGSEQKDMEEEINSLKLNEVVKRRSHLNFVPRKLFVDSGEMNSVSAPRLSEGETKVVGESSSSDLSLTSGQTSCDHPNNGEDGGMADFWSKQMNSLKEATGNTLALFQLGLSGQDDEDKNKIARRNMKFVEDIEAANEESESLILHDLEDEKCPQKKITGEARELDDSCFPSSSKSIGVAFGGSVEGEKSITVDPKSMSTNNGDRKRLKNTFQSTLNNSIEIATSRQDDRGGKKSKDEEESEDTESETEDDLRQEFKPSMWNQNLAPIKPSIKSPEILEGTKSTDPPTFPANREVGMRKSVSFERKKTRMVYKYPPQVVISDSEDEDTQRPVQFGSGGPLELDLDWELNPDEMDEHQFNNEDWDDEVDQPLKARKEDVYKISGVDDSFDVKSSNQPFAFTSTSRMNPSESSSSASSLGELRHTRDKLKLDLSRGEASVLDEDSKNPMKLDSGVGSTTSTNNISPFGHCDN